jgi:hypothetical protein
LWFQANDTSFARQASPRPVSTTRRVPGGTTFDEVFE